MYKRIKKAACAALVRNPFVVYPCAFRRAVNRNKCVKITVIRVRVRVIGNAADRAVLFTRRFRVGKNVFDKPNVQTSERIMCTADERSDSRKMCKCHGINLSSRIADGTAYEINGFVLFPLRIFLQACPYIVQSNRKDHSIFYNSL